jgi:multidrug efflux pump subunit AcrB
VARALTPMMASRLMRPDSHVEQPGRFKDWYMSRVQVVLRHRWLTIGASTLVMLGTFMLARTLPTGFTPTEDFGFVSLNVSLPPGSTMENSRDVAEQIRTRLAQYKEVVHTTVTISPRSASSFITLVERKERELSQQELQQKMIADMRSIPGIRIQTAGGMGPPGAGPLEIQLTGDNSTLLASAALDIEREMRNVPGFSNVTTSTSLLQPELTIRPRADRAAELGVTTSAISQATRIATSGDITNNLSKLNLPDRQIPIRVRLNDNARKDIEQIKLLQVPSRFGPVPLMNVADVSLGAGPSQITRYNRSRNITITADRGSIPLGDATDIIDNLPSMKNLPAGVRPVESGEAEIMRNIFSGFALAMVIGIFCIYALLVLLFHDVLQPITILSALPPSAGGAIVMLWLLKMDLSLPSLIGLLTLMGIVTKNSILLVEYIVMARREHGLSRYDAILDACSKRVRPILMTTIAMVAGMIPITIGLHGDSSFRAPMGAAVIGGLLASTALSLFVVPVIYTLMDDLEHAIKRLFGRSTAAAAAANTPAH